MPLTPAPADPLSDDLREIRAVWEAARALGVPVEVILPPTGDPTYRPIVPPTRDRVAISEQLRQAKQAAWGEAGNGVPRAGPEEQTGAVTG